MLANISISFFLDLSIVAAVAYKLSGFRFKSWGYQKSL